MTPTDPTADQIAKPAPAPRPRKRRPGRERAVSQRTLRAAMALYAPEARPEEAELRRREAELALASSTAGKEKW